MMPHFVKAPLHASFIKSCEHRVYYRIRVVSVSALFGPPQTCLLLYLLKSKFEVLAIYVPGSRGEHLENCSFQEPFSFQCFVTLSEAHSAYTLQEVLFGLTSYLGGKSSLPPFLDSMSGSHSVYCLAHFLVPCLFICSSLLIFRKLFENFSHDLYIRHAQC